MVCRCLLIAAVCYMLPVAGWGQAADVWNGSIANGFSGGDGNEATPYRISTGAELAYLAKGVNDGSLNTSGKHFKLTNDIDLNDKAWTPIGASRYFFQGNFDGDNHTISNLYIPKEENMHSTGLFGYIYSYTNITIKNLGISISELGITGVYAGGIIGKVGSNSGTLTISNCFVTGSLIESKYTSDEAFAGGMIGHISASGLTINIKNCYTCVNTVTARTDYGAANAGAGGIIGRHSDGTLNLTNCFSLCKNISAYAPNSYSPEAGNLVALESGGSITYTNCFSSPMTAITTDAGPGPVTTYPTAPGGNDQNGILLTQDNFNDSHNNALEGWATAGWHLNGDNLPTLADGDGSPAIDDYIWIGDGSQGAPYQIKNENLLRMITSSSYQNKYFIMANSFELTSEWTPLKNFAGVFDGNGYVISGLKIPQSKSAEAAGLFASLVSGAKVSNLGIMIKDEVSAEGGSAESGGIAGKCESGASIENCFVAGGKITGLSAGSIAGTNDGTIYGCYATTEVAGIANASIGGISGSNTGTIQNSYAIGKIAETDASNKAGGISGTNTGTIENCLALNKEGISGTTGQGRITGENSGTLTNNYATLFISGTWENEGAALKDGAIWEGNTYPFLATRSTSVWDMTTDPTLLPRLQSFIDKTTPQPADNLKKAIYQVFKVTLTQPAANGTIAVTHTGGTLVDGENIHIPSNTVLTLTATPDAGFQLKTFTADAAPISNTHTVIADVTLSATFEPIPVPPVTPDPDPDPVPDPSPTVYYTVTLPAVEGATTDPVAGEYEVESWGSFRFYLTLDKEYDKSEPVVKTDRFETITPRSSDGAYVVKYVRGDVEIFIDGIVKNPDPVGNEVVATDAVNVWAAKGNLHISTVTGQTARVYNLAGSLVKQAEIPAGDTLWPLPSGIYIVQIADTRYKVIL